MLTLPCAMLLLFVALICQPCTTAGMRPGIRHNDEIDPDDLSLSSLPSRGRRSSSSESSSSDGQSVAAKKKGKLQQVTSGSGKRGKKRGGDGAMSDPDYVQQQSGDEQNRSSSSIDAFCSSDESEREFIEGLFAFIVRLYLPTIFC